MAEMNLTQSVSQSVSQLSQRCLNSFFSSQAQMADLELSLSNNQTQTEEETNNFLNIIYGQFSFILKNV